MRVTHVEARAIGERSSGELISRGPSHSGVLWSDGPGIAPLAASDSDSLLERAHSINRTIGA